LLFLAEAATFEARQSLHRRRRACLRRPRADLDGLVAVAASDFCVQRGQAVEQVLALKPMLTGVPAKSTSISFLRVPEVGVVRGDQQVAVVELELDRAASLLRQQGHGQRG
jgi:hypothetical protein